MNNKAATINNSEKKKKNDLSASHITIICLSLSRQLQQVPVIDLFAFDKTQYFAITKFNNNITVNSLQTLVRNSIKEKKVQFF